MLNRSFLPSAGACALVLAVSACGGGGGGMALIPPPPTPTPNPTPTPTTPTTAPAPSTALNIINGAPTGPLAVAGGSASPNGYSQPFDKVTINPADQPNF